MILNFIEEYTKEDYIKNIPNKVYKKNDIIIYNNHFYVIIEILENN